MDMLTGRTAVPTLGVEMEGLFPLLWCLVENLLPNLPSSEGYYTQAYRDNVVVFIRERYGNTVEVLLKGVV